MTVLESQIRRNHVEYGHMLVMPGLPVRIRQWTRWLKHVRSSCRTVWIYIPGYIERPVKWRRTFGLISLDGGVWAGTMEMLFPLVDYAGGISSKRRWRDWATTKVRPVSELIRRVQGEQPFPVGFVAEDFGAEIVMRMSDAIRPAFAALGNPILSSADPSFLAMPGHIRSVRMPWESSLRLWGASESLVRGERIEGIDHLHWEAAKLGGLKAAIANGRTLGAWS